jgi:hypothetical protein
MKISKLKIVAVVVWAFFMVMFASTQNFWSAKGQTVGKKTESNPKPEMSQIDFFDSLIQKRFLIKPDFGIRRIQPVFPPSPHLEFFDAEDGDETKSVNRFINEGWQGSIYLFGRIANPKVINGKEQASFSINYRLNKPLAMTKNIKQTDLPKAEKLLKKVKSAFIAFQTPNSENENNYEFSLGKWSYVAKPVRAVNESCIRCHTDYVITEKLGDGKFTFRKRKVGDANGVIVYGFSKDK